MVSRALYPGQKKRPTGEWTPYDSFLLPSPLTVPLCIRTDPLELLWWWVDLNLWSLWPHTIYTHSLVRNSAILVALGASLFFAPFLWSFIYDVNVSISKHLILNTHLSFSNINLRKWISHQNSFKYHLYFSKPIDTITSTIRVLIVLRWKWKSISTPSPP